MKAYLIRVAWVMTSLAVGILVLIGAFILWIKLGEALIPQDVTYHDARVIAYCGVSLIVLLSLIVALDKDLFE